MNDVPGTTKSGDAKTVVPNGADALAAVPSPESNRVETALSAFRALHLEERIAFFSRLAEEAHDSGSLLSRRKSPRRSLGIFKDGPLHDLERDTFQRLKETESAADAE
jgi:hypothetical protein